MPRGKRAISRPIPEAFVGVLDGLMLGDGNLWAAKTRPTCNAMYRQSSISEDWLRDTADMFDEIEYPTQVYFDRIHRCKNGRISSIWFLQTCASPELTRHRKRWYPEGKKRLPLDLKLTAPGVLQWYLGDGTLRPDRFAAFCAEWYNRDEIDFLREELCDLLNEAGVRPTPRRAGWNLELSMNATASLFDLLGPCPYPSLAHKWWNRDTVRGRTAKAWLAKHDKEN